MKVSAKLQFIGNDDPFRDSSAGVQFFSAASLSARCFFVQEIIGFVEDLVVEDDPESSWQDYFRSANKASNDNRLKVLCNLSAEVRRELGRKVMEAGGNAVLAFSVHFDIEGASGIVARANGTACRLLKVGEDSSVVNISRAHFDSFTSNTGASSNDWGSLFRGGIAAKSNNSSREARRVVAKGSSMLMLSRESAEILSPKLTRKMSNETLTVTGEALVLLQEVNRSTAKAVHLIPFGVNKEKINLSMGLGGGVNSIGGGIMRMVKNEFGDVITGDNNNNNVFQAEIQLITLKQFESNVRVKLGGLVLARSNYIFFPIFLLLFYVFDYF
jgi:hypothetical protein